MDDTVDYLPLFCQQLMRSPVSRVHVRRWVERVRQQWRASRESPPEVRGLNRTKQLLQREALLFVREHALCVEQALAQLSLYAEGGRLTEVQRACAWCTRGERARQNYLSRRAALEKAA